MGRLSDLLAGGARREFAGTFEAGVEDLVDWLDDVHRVLVCGGENAAGPMEGCRLCAFIEDIRPSLGTDPAFRDLVRHHALLHDRGEGFLRLAQRGARPARGPYDEFLEARQAALRCIVELELTSRELDGL